MLISVPPKCWVALEIGFLQGKSTIHIARCLRNNRNVRGERFSVRGYFVSTVGGDEDVVRDYTAKARRRRPTNRSTGPRTEVEIGLHWAAHEQPL
jgi:hypothetical protein